jgi:hypothetical protein
MPQLTRRTRELANPPYPRSGCQLAALFLHPTCYRPESPYLKNALTAPAFPSNLYPPEISLPRFWNCLHKSSKTVCTNLLELFAQIGF